MADAAPTTYDIVAEARSNDAFRREVITGEHTQVVLMTIPPGGARPGPAPVGGRIVARSASTAHRR